MIIENFKLTSNLKNRKMNTPTLFIELNVFCPHCGEYINLLDYETGMNHEGEIIKQACPQNGQWDDSHDSFEEEVKCTACKKTFKCEGINW